MTMNKMILSSIKNEKSTTIIIAYQDENADELFDCCSSDDEDDIKIAYIPNRDENAVISMEELII